VLPLHSHEAENVALVRWAPGTRFADHAHWGGEEIFVLEGTFQDEHGAYPAGTWIRSPHLSRHNPWSDEGCLIYVKTGHLPNMAA
jgi:anti-sigma factor ChrR (cupin superfamily)